MTRITSTVLELQERGWLLVEDGNHGEYRPLSHEFGYGATKFIRAADLNNGAVQFESAERINDTARQRIRKGIGAPLDVLLSHKGTVGKVAFAGASVPPFVCSPQTTFWRSLDSTKIDQRYLYCFLRSPRFHEQLQSRKDETDMAPYVSLTSQRQLKVELPPINEQRAIARVLGALDDKIELNRRLNRSLEELAQAVFRSWFVDFDPVTAKAAGRAPVGLDPTTAALFPNEFQDSELGEIPRNWQVRGLPDIIEMNPKRSLRKDIEAPYLDMSNMPTNGHSPLTWVSRQVGSGMRFQNGDTLVARITPCLENGKTAFVDFLEDGQIAWGSTEYIVLRPKSPIPDVFAYCLARSERFRDFAIQAMTGSSGRQRVPAENLAMFSLVAPPDQIAMAFGRAVNPLFAKSKVNTDQNRLLAAARDSLLPPLLSGELRMPQVERLVEQLV